MADSLTTHCMKCKQQRPMVNVEHFIMKNGKQALKGKCEVCGGNVVKLGPAKV